MSMEKKNYFATVSWKDEKFSNCCSMRPINISLEFYFTSAKKSLITSFNCIKWFVPYEEPNPHTE